MAHYYWSTPAIIVFYAIIAWTSKNNSAYAGKWFYIVWGMSCIPLWAIISRCSKSILFDGMLFDMLSACTYIMTMIYLGAAKDLTVLNKCGIMVVVTGLIMMKIPK